MARPPPLYFQKGRVPKQAHVAIPEGLYEEEHGRQGFAGRVSQLYHRHPPNQWTRIEGPLKPQLIDTAALEPSDFRDPRGEPLRVLYNDDVSIAVSRRAERMPFCFRNGDGDELHFIHRGAGLLRTDYGPLRYEPGDYLLIPKGTTYQIVPDKPDNMSLVIQSRGEIGFPERGNVGHYAPFDYGVIETPEPEVIQEDGSEWELRIVQRGLMSSVFYSFCPFDVVGWKGDLTVMKLNIRDIRPLMSEGVHLPPSAHCTLEAPGFAVCTLLPRPLEGDPKAQRLPWYHRDVDIDETFFIHQGTFSFTGNPDAPGPGMLLHEPQGLHHGPPASEIKEMESNWNEYTRLQLTAINVDCVDPLVLSPEIEKKQS